MVHSINTIKAKSIAVSIIQATFKTEEHLNFLMMIAILLLIETWTAR